MVLKKKEVEVQLDEENKLNVSIFKENGNFVKFAINYSAKINGKWQAVYRVDNYHGFLHEQRLWLTKKPIPLPEYENCGVKEVFDIFYEKISENCLKFRKYFEMNENG